MSIIHTAVKAVILSKDKFLVLKQILPDGRIVWDLPGGKVKYGEDPYATLHREIMEETTLTVDIIKALGLWWFIRAKDGDQVICHTFLCKPQHLRVDLSKNDSSEHIGEFRWVTKEEFL
ncbi:NUDIX hydrolase, partial [Candidatus Woesearchaeota archaeon]|nr:NUDIX hydrolase [Candidatus Woesearchaeota archaeon]